MTSRQKTAFIATGVLAWLGGVATALAISSCDVDPCEEMNPDDPLCQPDPLEGRSQEGAVDSLRAPPEPGPECSPVAHPSVHVVPVQRFDDYFVVVDVNTVWFEHEGKVQEARCVMEDDECTGAWIAGYGLAGRITVSTEYCDHMVSKTVEVGHTEDGCHVESEFVMLEVNTTGCETTPPPETTPPESWRLITRPVKG